MTKKRQIAFHLDDKLADATATQALEEGRSRNGYIRFLIEADLEAKGALSHEAILEIRRGEGV